MQKRLTLVVGSGLIACLAIITLSLTKVEAATCQVPEPARPAKFVVNVPAPTNTNPVDIAKVVNGDSATRATVFQLAANATYRVNALIVLKAGDELRGAVGTKPQVPGSVATDPNPTTKLENGAALESLIALRGDNAITWLDMRGADYKGQSGSGSAIAAGSGDDDTWIQYNRIHLNGAAGITNAHGHILDNEIDNNTTDRSALGVIAAGVKGIVEYEAGCNYVHENLGHGLWGDVLMKDTTVGSFNVHDNVLSNNGRAGVRFERTECSGAEFSAVGNTIQNNGEETVRGGVSIHDACNSYVANNTFGGNWDRLAVRITDSGRSDRPDTKNATIEQNTMNGENVKLGTGISTSADNIIIK